MMLLAETMMLLRCLAKLREQSDLSEKSIRRTAGSYKMTQRFGKTGFRAVVPKLFDKKY